MNFTPGQNILMLGVGGIGMSALARYLKARGCDVSGYDRTETPLTIELENAGINVVYDLKEVGLSEVELIIYTPAVGEGNSVLSAAREADIPTLKRSQVLGEICKNFRTIAIAGTHGKTTTASMTAFLLKSCGVDCNAFIGGIAVNFDSNYLAGKSNWMVVEADEFDRSFLTLFPELAAINSIDPDHLDIYETHDAMRECYQAFADQVLFGGKLFLQESLKNEFHSSEKYEIKYCVESPPSPPLPGGELRNVSPPDKGGAGGDVSVQNIRANGLQMMFDFSYKNLIISDIELNMAGRHNVLNMAVALALAIEAGAKTDKLKAAVGKYKGVRRRFEVRLNTPDCIYIDDYAHHPTEIASAIEAAKSARPDWPLVVAFQPHLFSRTRDFYQGFAQALGAADRLYLLDIYPARELSIPGITSEIIINETHLKDKHLINLNQLSNRISEDIKRPTIFMTLGAGDIDTQVEAVEKALSKLKFAE